MENFVTISGCSGGGKSTLLAELRRRGFVTIDEPGRRVVAENSIAVGGVAVDAVASARRDRGVTRRSGHGRRRRSLGLF